jgi:wobble nucleotide-excising tRNase
MRDVDTKLNRLEKRLKPHIQGSMSCSEFVALQPVLDVQERTRNQELVVSRMENAEAIRTKGSLREVKIPTVNRAALEGTLARSLDDIDKESVQLVKKYVERALDENGEDWLSYGAERVKGNRCPFCGQAVRDCRLVEAYREYFSRAYREFKTELTRAAGDVEAAFSVDARAAVMETIAANSGPWEFWQAHVKQEITTPDRDALTRLWTDAAEAIKGVLARKSSNPPRASTSRSGFGVASSRYSRPITPQSRRQTPKSPR